MAPTFFSSVKQHREYIESKIKKYDKEQERERLLYEISRLKRELCKCLREKEQLQNDLDQLSEVVLL